MPATALAVSGESATTARVELDMYLSALFARAAGEYVDVRWRRGDWMGERFIATSRLGDVARLIARLANRTDVYVGVAPRTTRSGQRSAVMHTFALWVDCDTELARRRLAAFTPASSIVVRSGSEHGRHAYWLLDTPLDIDDAERLNERLAVALDADPRCAEGARILRPPITTNHKRDQLAAVAVESLTSELHSAELIARALPELPPPDPPRSLTAFHGRDRGTDPLRTIAPDRYVARLCGVEVPRNRKIRCPLHDDHTPSLHVYREPERGWYCYGCQRGGDIYDLAGALWHLDTHADTFVELRQRLRDLFALH